MAIAHGLNFGFQGRSAGAETSVFLSSAAISGIAT
jgi:hypothetical protein